MSNEEKLRQALALERQAHEKSKADLEVANAELKMKSKALTRLAEHLAENLQAELISKKRELEEAYKVKTTFLANMSHELRTPLTAIIGYTDLLQEALTQSEHQTILEVANRNAKHLLLLINDILDFSKLGANKLTIEKIPIYLVDLIEDVRDVIALQAQSKELPFHIYFQFPVPSVFVSDYTRVKQILLNLCSNAVKFTEKGQVSLTITVTSDRKTVSFAVQDTGIGIPEERLKYLFNPFEQGGVSINRKFGGTGLGLSISQQLARLMGGDLLVTSVLQEGSLFTCDLPCQITAETTWLLNEQQIASLQGESHKSMAIPLLTGRVLIAEDYDDIRELIFIYLSKTGLTVTVTKNGAEAVEAALAENYDVIFLDIRMPIMSGVEAIKLLRSAGITGPVIAMTANTQREEIERYLELGFSDYVSKPVHWDTVFQKLSLLLAEKKTEKVCIQDSDAFIEEIATIKTHFLETLPIKRAQLLSAYEQKDYQKLGDIIHVLKGAGGSFGYQDMTILAQILVKRLSQQYPDISEPFEQLICYLESLIKTGEEP